MVPIFPTPPMAKRVHMRPRTTTFSTYALKPPAAHDDRSCVPAATYIRACRGPLVLFWDFCCLLVWSFRLPSPPNDTITRNPLHTPQHSREHRRPKVRRGGGGRNKKKSTMIEVSWCGHTRYTYVGGTNIRVLELYVHTGLHVDSILPRTKSK